MSTNPDPHEHQAEPTTRAIDYADAINRLRSISRRIDSFFESQLEKLQHSMEHLSSMHAENDLTRRLAADLEEQRRRWEREKVAESKRLVEAGEALAAAWAELESKERHINLTSVPVEKPRAQDPESTETSLFEIQMLQQQVAEHARRMQR